MKSILLIGLGRFGATMAMKLYELKHEVMAIDISEERINAILPYVTSAQIGDCTNEQYMASIGVRNLISAWWLSAIISRVPWKPQPS